MFSSNFLAYIYSMFMQFFARTKVCNVQRWTLPTAFGRVNMLLFLQYILAALMLFLLEGRAFQKP